MIVLLGWRYNTHMLDDIAIVLVEPSHPGNVGAVARAMKTMGLRALRLVNPAQFPHEEATRRAAGADDVLHHAALYSTLKEAVADCAFVYGTSVRAREVAWPLYSVREAALRIQHQSELLGVVQSAVVFGRERSGLSNHELDLCDAQIMIPANPEYGSLNLASAVQIISYELRMASLKTETVDDCTQAASTGAQKRQLPASKEEREGHLAHLHEVLEALDFIKSKPSDLLQRKIARLYNKAELTVEEVQILRGILTATQSMLRSPKQ